MALVQGETVNITPRQVEVLHMLAQRERWSVGEVASKMEVSSAAATKAILRLERKGLVTRTIDMMDRRCVIVRVTRLGTELAHHAPKTQRTNG